MPDYTLFDPEEVQTDVEALVRQIAGVHGVDPDHIVRMARQESGLDQSAVSPKGATGVMQLMPGTAKDYLADPNDLHQNIDAGVRYYKDLLGKFDNDPVKATAAYNFGPSRVGKGEPWPEETKKYVAAVVGKNGKNGKSPSWEAEFDPSQIQVVGEPGEPTKAAATVDLDPAQVTPVPIPSEAELAKKQTEISVMRMALEGQGQKLVQNRAALEAEAQQIGPDSTPEQIAAFREKFQLHNLELAELNNAIEGHGAQIRDFNAGLGAYNENLQRYANLKVAPGAEKTGTPGIPGPRLGMRPEYTIPEGLKRFGKHFIETNITNQYARPMEEPMIRPSLLLPTEEEAKGHPLEGVIAAERGLTRAIEPLTSMESAGTVALGAGATTALRGIVNLPVAVKLLQNSPVVMKAADFAALAAVPAGFAVLAGNGSILEGGAAWQAAKRGDYIAATEHGAAALGSAAIAAFAAAGALKAGKGALGAYPPEVTPEARAEAEKVGGIAQPPGAEQAGARAAALEASGERLAAEAWKSLDRTAPVETVIDGRPALIGPLEKGPKGQWIATVTDKASGKVLNRGFSAEVDNWLQTKRATAPPESFLAGEGTRGVVVTPGEGVALETPPEATLPIRPTQGAGQVRAAPTSPEFTAKLNVLETGLAKARSAAGKAQGAGTPDPRAEAEVAFYEREIATLRGVAGAGFEYQPAASGAKVEPPTGPPAPPSPSTPAKAVKGASFETPSGTIRVLDVKKGTVFFEQERGGQKIRGSLAQPVFEQQFLPVAHPPSAAAPVVPMPTGAAAPSPQAPIAVAPAGAPAPAQQLEEPATANYQQAVEFARVSTGPVTDKLLWTNLKIPRHQGAVLIQKMKREGVLDQQGKPTGKAPVSFDTGTLVPAGTKPAVSPPPPSLPSTAPAAETGKPATPPRAAAPTLRTFEPEEVTPVAPEGQRQTKLPRELAGAMPRYNYGAKSFELEFASDLDRAAYITAQKTRSKRDADYLAFVRQATGLKEPEVRTYGERVRTAIKQQAKDAEPGKLTVPDVGPEEKPIKAEKPAAAPVQPAKATDKSVRDFPVTATVKGDTITVTTKLAGEKISTITLKRDEWPTAAHPGPTIGNPAYDQRELIRTKMANAGVADFAEEGAAQAERIADAHVSAINAALKEEKKAEKPAPRPAVPREKGAVGEKPQVALPQAAAKKEPEKPAAKLTDQEIAQQLRARLDKEAPAAIARIKAAMAKRAAATEEGNLPSLGPVIRPTAQPGRAPVAATGIPEDLKDVWPDLKAVAAHKIVSGQHRFARFADAMVAEFGEWVRPHAQALYDDASDWIEAESDKARGVKPVAKAEKEEYDYASTQVNLPPGPVVDAILAYGREIPDEDLASEAGAKYGGESAAKGRETQPHVTVKYGLHDEDPESVRKLLENEPPVKLKLGRTSIFAGTDNGDVLKLDVESEDLVRLNKKIADALPNTETHPGYKPHVTIAYLKAGKGKEYAGQGIPGITGREITLDRIVFSDKSGKQTEIRLKGEPEKVDRGIPPETAPKVLPTFSERQLTEAEADLRRLRTEYEGTEEGSIDQEDLARQIHAAAARLDRLQAEAARENPLLAEQPEARRDLPPLPAGKESHYRELLDNSSDLGFTAAEEYVIDRTRWEERGKQGKPPEKPVALEAIQKANTEYPENWQRDAAAEFQRSFDAEIAKADKEAEADRAREQEIQKAEETAKVAAPAKPHVPGALQWTPGASAAERQQFDNDPQDYYEAARFRQKADKSFIDGWGERFRSVTGKRGAAESRKKIDSDTTAVKEQYARQYTEVELNLGKATADKLRAEVEEKEVGPLPNPEGFKVFWDGLRTGDKIQAPAGVVEVVKSEAFLMQPIIPGGPGGRWGAFGRSTREVNEVEAKLPDGTSRKFDRTQLLDYLYPEQAKAAAPIREEGAEGEKPQVSPPEAPAEKPAEAPTQYALTGDTYIHRVQIKRLGGTWNAAEKAWIIPADKLAEARKISNKIAAKPYGAKTVQTPIADKERIGNIQQAETYVKRIVNAQKRHYAGAYMRYLLGEARKPLTTGDAGINETLWRDLSTMGAQAVRTELREILGKQVEPTEPSETGTQVLRSLVYGIISQIHTLENALTGSPQNAGIEATQLKKLVDQAGEYAEKLTAAPEAERKGLRSAIAAGNKLVSDFETKPQGQVRAEKPDQDHNAKAAQLWAGMDENQRAGVRAGLFPAEIMHAAEAEGYNGKDLAVALMEQAKKTVTPRKRFTQGDSIRWTAPSGREMYGFITSVSNTEYRVRAHPAGAPSEAATQTIEYVPFDAADLRKDTGGSEAPVAAPEKGDRVEIQLKGGATELGTVIAVNPDGTYTVRHDGGRGVEMTWPLEKLRPVKAEAKPATRVPKWGNLTDIEAEILRNLDQNRQMHLGTLLSKLPHFDQSDVMSELLNLELHNLVKQLPGKNFVRAPAGTTAIGKGPAEAYAPNVPEALTGPRSYKYELQISGEGDKWHQNGLAFQTRDEAEKAGSAHFSRWMMARGHRVVVSDEKPNYFWDDEAYTTKPLSEKEKGVEGEKPEVAPPEATAKERTGSEALADAIYQKLKAGDSLGNITELNKLAEEHFGSGRTAGEWTPRDAFDAMETGVNRYLLDRGKGLLALDADKGLAELRDLMGRLTTQATRTDEQVKNQQFSTPPTEAYLVAKLADLKPEDVVLEPSAGNGGLAVWPKAIGATVHVNEISERRIQNLETLGFGKPSAHDGEIINALLDPSIQPTVVMMNPPFSAGTVKSGEARNRNLYGFNHVDSALQRLAPGGRLVAILGGGQANEPEGGASLVSGQSAGWFRKLSGQYNIRANVRVSGKEYAKYGTGFATRIIVIDKDGPTNWGRIVKGNVETLEEAYNLLRDVAQSRPKATVLPGTLGTRGAGEGQPGTRVGAGAGAGQPVRPGVLPGGRGTPAPAEPAGRPTEPPGSAVGLRPGAGGERDPLREPELQPEGYPGRGAAEGPRGGAANVDVERPLSGTETDDASLSLGRAPDQPHLKSEEEDSSAYAVYRPALGGEPHPGAIVETKTMATVPMPEISYKPHLPPSAGLSAIQMEAVAIAGQQNAIVLPGGFRGSALVGDGTGVGKGRIAAGVLWDNYRQGRRRLVWISEKWDLMQDAVRDIKGVGAKDLLRGITEQEGKFVFSSNAAVIPFNKFKATDKIEHDGLLFSTYALIRSEDKKGNRRVAQLERYLRGEDDGEGAYIVFDESHNLKNAVASQRGQESQIGRTVKELLGRMPKLRIVSLSATAATDVVNLGYLDRLGIWGPGTPFPNGFGEFQSQIASGGMSAMELIARELKAQGKYVSRTLSFKGVEYSEEEHRLTDEQKDLYRTAAKAWSTVYDHAETTIHQVTNGGSKAMGRFMSQFYGTQQRFFNLLITTLKIPTAVELANKALTDGKAVVVTLVNTNEAAQNREKNKAQDLGDEDEIPDYDFGPKEMLVQLVRDHYPVQQWKDDVDSAGNPVKVPVYKKDKEGREIPVLNPEAVRLRDELIAQIERDLNMPENPLDILIQSLGGHKKVAEITGRKERYDRSLGRFVSRGDPNVPRKEINLAEMRNFQNGKKDIAILSGAGGTGISLHAGNDVKNQKRRFHMTLQVGWSADKQMQFFGRTHRTNQKHAPEYVMLVSDLGGEKRFVSTIARRLGSLGALTKGQKNATSGTDLLEKVNFETDQGRQATNAFYVALLQDDPIPGTGLTGMQILTDLHVLKPAPGAQGKTVPPADRTNVTRLLNRLLALDPDIQNPTYGYFYDIFQAIVKDAMDRGQLDTGVKTLPGDEFTVKEERSISKDPKTGAETFYYPVDAKIRTHRLSSEDLDTRIRDHKKDKPVILRHENGKVFLAIEASPIVHADARIDPASYVASPANGKWVKRANYELRRMKPVAEWAKEQLEEASEAVADTERSINYAQRELERTTQYDQWAQRSLASSQAKLQEQQPALDAAAAIAEDPDAWAKARWKEQYEEAPSHVTEEHHLIGGAVMRWWNAIRDAAPVGNNIYTTVDSKGGQRVVGVDVPPDRITQLLARITGGGSTVSTDQLITDVLRNNLTYTLEGNIQVRRGRVNRIEVIQLIPPSQEAAENLKRLGVVHERGVVPVYYVPNNYTGPMETRTSSIVENILEQYPVTLEETGAPTPESGDLAAREPSAPLPTADFEKLAAADPKVYLHTDTEPHFLWADQNALALLKATLPKNQQTWQGMHFTHTSGLVIASRLREGAEGLSAKGTRKLEAIAGDIETAVQDYRPLLVVGHLPGETWQQLRSRVQHERFHWFQTQEAGGEMQGVAHIDAHAFLDDSLARKALRSLVEEGYPPVTDDYRLHAMAAEVGAHLAQGPHGWMKMGLTREETQQLFSRYLDHLIERHGPEIVSKIPRIASQLNGVLDEARTKASEVRHPGDQPTYPPSARQTQRELLGGIRQGVPEEAPAGLASREAVVTPRRGGLGWIATPDGEVIYEEDAAGHANMAHFVGRSIAENLRRGYIRGRGNGIEIHSLDAVNPAALETAVERASWNSAELYVDTALRSMVYDTAELKEAGWDLRQVRPVESYYREAGAAGMLADLGGVNQFVKEDVAPTLGRVARNIAVSRDEILKLLAPAARGEEAKQTALTVRYRAAELARKGDQAIAALEEARNYFNSKPEWNRLDFIDRVETGQRQLDPREEIIGGLLRKMLDERRETVRALGTGKLENWIENYFPHIWEQRSIEAKFVSGKPDPATQFAADWLSKRPLEGKKAFLKRRTIPTTREGMDAGLTPVSTNPVDLLLAKLREMDKYVMAHRAFQDLKEMGLLKFVRATAKAPVGYAKIEDKIATVYGPRRGAVKLSEEAKEAGVTQEDVEVAGIRIMGYYWAPEPAARVMNNYLSPGLRGSILFRGYLGIGNMLNQFQLGWSAFHLMFTSNDAAVSKFGLGLYQLAHGHPLKALGSIAMTPLAPITNIFQGAKLLKEWDRPGTQSAEIARFVEAMVQAGGRARMDKFYQTHVTKRMMETFRGALQAWQSGNWIGAGARIVGAGIRLPFALTEQSVRPILEYIVPRQKMGVFADMSRFELERLGPGASEMEKRAAYARAWDSVDNRMGQLVYDNLFWNKVLKDVAMGSIRSVGWNTGTIRELVGGAADTVKAVNDGLHGRPPDVTWRMSYLLALPIVMGIVGAIFQYLMTGKGPADLRDVYAPRTGLKDKSGMPERMMPASYMKDVIHYGKEPFRTLTNKFHPFPSLILDVLRNENFQHRKIRDPEDPLEQQLADLAEHVGKQFVPIAWRGWTDPGKKRVQPNWTEEYLPFIGITPAPRAIKEGGPKPARGGRTFGAPAFKRASGF